MFQEDYKNLKLTLTLNAIPRLFETRMQRNDGIRRISTSNIQTAIVYFRVSQTFSIATIFNLFKFFTTLYN